MGSPRMGDFDDNDDSHFFGRSSFGHSKFSQVRDYSFKTWVSEGSSSSSSFIQNSSARRVRRQEFTSSDTSFAQQLDGPMEGSPPQLYSTAASQGSTIPYMFAPVQSGYGKRGLEDNRGEETWGGALGQESLPGTSQKYYVEEGDSGDADKAYDKYDSYQDDDGYYGPREGPGAPLALPSTVPRSPKLSPVMENTDNTDTAENNGEGRNSPFVHRHPFADVPVTVRALTPSVHSKESEGSKEYRQRLYNLSQHPWGPTCVVTPTNGGGGQLSERGADGESLGLSQSITGGASHYQGRAADTPIYIQKKYQDVGLGKQILRCGRKLVRSFWTWVTVVAVLAACEGFNEESHGPSKSKKRDELWSDDDEDVDAVKADNFRG